MAGQQGGELRAALDDLPVRSGIATACPCMVKVGWCRDAAAVLVRPLPALCDDAPGALLVCPERDLRAACTRTTFSWPLLSSRWSHIRTTHLLPPALPPRWVFNVLLWLNAQVWHSATAVFLSGHVALSSLTSAVGTVVTSEVGEPVCAMRIPPFAPTISCRSWSLPTCVRVVTSASLSDSIVLEQEPVRVRELVSELKCF